jgi:hypothetical protein
MLSLISCSSNFVMLPLSLSTLRQDIYSIHEHSFPTFHPWRLALPHSSICTTLSRYLASSMMRIETSFLHNQMWNRVSLEKVSKATAAGKEVKGVCLTSDMSQCLTAATPLKVCGNQYTTRSHPFDLVLHTTSPHGRQTGLATSLTRRHHSTLSQAQRTYWIDIYLSREKTTEWVSTNSGEVEVGAANPTLGVWEVLRQGHVHRGAKEGG